MPENLLTITIHATCIEHAQELLAARSMPATLPATAEGNNELLADLKAAEFALKDEKQAREDLWSDLQTVAKERDDARAELLLADGAREALQDTCDNLGSHLDAVAEALAFKGPMGRLVEHAAAIAAQALQYRQHLEAKRLADAGLPPTAPERQPLTVGTQVWIGEPGSAEAGTVAEWRVEEGGSYAYAVALDGKPDPVWVCEGDGDFHLERPKRKRRTKAEIQAEQAPWVKTYEPGEVVTASVDGEDVQASVVRQFDGSTKYEVEIAGRGLAVLDASQLAPLLDLQPEHEFPDTPVTDGPNDDPLVNDEQYAAVKTKYEALGLSVSEVKAITQKHFGTTSGRELRVSQARQLVDTILPASVTVPEALPF